MPYSVKTCLLWLCHLKDISFLSLDFWPGGDGYRFYLLSLFSLVKPLNANKEKTLSKPRKTRLWVSQKIIIRERGRRIALKKQFFMF